MLKNYIDKFISDLQIKKRSNSTIIAYKKDLEQLNEFLTKQGSKNITDVSLDLLNNFLGSQRKLGFKEKTISRKINSIKTFYRYLTTKENLNVNMAEKLEHPKLDNPPPNFLSRMEYMALRDVSRRNIRNYTIIELMLQSGLRISEVANLRMEDVKLDLEKPEIKIRPYGSNLSRKIKLNQRAEDALKDYLKTMKHDQEYLFTTKTGRPLLVRNIRTSISKLLEKAGVTKATVNDLRNTHIVHYLKEGMNIDKLAKQVGHKRVTTTQRYLDLIDKEQIKKGNKRYEDL